MKNLKSILTLLMAVVVLSLPCRADDGRAAKPVKVSGTVTVDGKARQGVVVSDGVEVVTTDGKGRYSFNSQGRQHVFVSLPADCEIPTDDPGHPLFYQLIEGKGKKVKYDFNLKSAPKADQWTLLALADVQIGYDKDLEDLTNQAMPLILNVTDTLTQPVFGISLGDLVWNNPGFYDEYREQVARTNIPVFSVIGNHDHNENTRGDIESDREFRDAMGPTYYSVNIGDCHMVVLDNIIYSGAKGRNDYSLGLTEQQLDWLEKDLAYVDKSKTLIVGMHAPSQRRSDLVRQKANPEQKVKKIKNADKLYEMVKDYADVQMLCGHMHYNFVNYIADNITETCLGAVNGAFWYPICDDGSPQGFGMLRFDGNKLVDKYYQGMGDSRDYQLKVYRPEDAVLHQPKAKPGDPYDKILINVFLWDDNWKVQVMEDGKDVYTINPDKDRVTLPACDPTIVRLVNPETGWLDANHNGSKPTVNCDHMFLYTPDKDWHTITVCATDPFGRMYVDAIGNTEK